MMAVPAVDFPQTDRVRHMAMPIQIRNQLTMQHYYDRFIGDKTELWLFGTGLGDQAIMEQLGASFLNVLDEDGDPALGKIILAMGHTPTAFYPWKGDHNLWYGWGEGPDWIDNYMRQTTIQPQACLAISKTCEEQLVKKGLKTLLLPLGVGDVFKPLGLERSGLGYAGNPIHAKEQYDAVLNGVMERPDFEWHGKRANSVWFSLEDLNKWYNSKKLVFAMVNPHSVQLNFLSNRVFETLASGTPFISYAHDGFRETLGFEYPYMTTNQETTMSLIDKILGDYPKVLEDFFRYSETVRREHNYKSRVRILLKWLGGE